MAETSKGRFEMLWDCPSCGTEKLLGITHRHCPNCGGAQDPARRYFPPEGEEVAVENHPWQGVDRACPACETPNAAKATFCVNCGSPMDGSKEVRQRDVKKEGEKDSASAAVKESEAAKQAAKQKMKDSQDQASGAAPPPAKSGGWMKFVMLGVAGVALLGCLGVGALLMFWKQDAAVAVTGHSWERTIAVETLKAVQKTAWQDEVPAGAAVGGCRQEQRSTKKVADGESCETVKKDKGDGTFEKVEECHAKYKEEPVYAQKCSYSITEWTVTDTAKAGGKATAPAPSWPAPAMSNPGACLGCQREGARKETYTLHFRDDKQRDQTCAVPMAKWSGTAVGSKWKGQTSMITGSLDCGSLQPR